MSIIPKKDKIHQQLAKICSESKVIVFVGLPGSGKSLFINHLYSYAESEKYIPSLIQWDVARKEFEKGELKTRFPTEAGQVHPMVRLSAGQWLLQFVKNWIRINKPNNNKRLLIEAPLVGNRFSELCHKQSDALLEGLLSSKDVQFVLPIPSIEVRKKIEDDRKAQISEDATNWSGAKPSVLHQLWKDTIDIARNLSLTTSASDDYDEDIYHQTYAHILQHRHRVKLEIDKIFPITIKDEDSLHSLENEIPTKDEVLRAIEKCTSLYTTDNQQVDEINNWYNT